jgi:hypothetical protein
MLFGLKLPSSDGFARSGDTDPPSFVCVCGMPVGDVEENLNGSRAGYEIPLHLIADFRLQEIQVLRRFDALGRNRQIQSVAETQDGANNRACLIVAMD